MPKVIQNNNQTLSNNVNSNNSKSSNSSVLSSVFARLVSILSSFILVLRHGLKKIKEFLGLFPYLRTLFPWRSSTFIKRSRQIRIVAFISCFAFVLLSFTILHPLSSPTQPTEAATGSSQSSSLTLDLASSSASVDLLVTDPEGSFAVSSSNAEFNVTTNNFTGYTLSIMSSNDEGLLTSTNGKSLSSITSAISLDTFAGSSSYNGKWGYRPSVYNAVANTSFLPSPTTTATTLDTTTAPNTSTPNYYTIEIGVRSDYTTASSSYTNTFIITAVSNPINYTISYDSHTSDNVTNMPATQSSSTMATNIVLSSNVPVRDGYDFMGWCTVAPDTTTPETCTGTTFQPGGDFGIDQTTLNNTTLYAMWKSQVPSTMQAITLSQCKKFASNGNYSLTDIRDGKKYTLRYINGACWMTQNLDYDPIVNSILDPATSDVSSTTTLSPSNTNTFNSSYTTQVVRSSSSYGHYYNYCAVTAGEICDNTNMAESTTSICPSGWRLPTYAEQNSLIDYVSEFAPKYGGYYSKTSLSSSGSYGYYWSSTAYTSSSQRRILRYNKSTLSTSYGTKYYGYNARCVKRYTPGNLAVIFNGNGNTGGSMDNQIIPAGTSANLSENEFIKTGYTLQSWNTKPDGSGTSYKNGGLYLAPPTSEDSTITLYAQWVKSFTVIFNGNGNTSGSMSNQIIDYGDNYLKDNSYTRTGYIFNGWNVSPNGNGEYITAGENFNYDHLVERDYVPGSSITLYAQWARVTSYYMQSFTMSQCQSQASSQPIAITDSRDNKIYTVRYINGICWMTKNLNLSAPLTLTPSDSNVTRNYTLPNKNLSLGASYTEARWSDDGIYGAHYNFCAASAGTICDDTLEQNSTEDICPKNWRLPNLQDINNITENVHDPDTVIGNAYTYFDEFAPVFNGFYSYNYDSNLVNQGEYGYWWSSDYYKGYRSVNQIKLDASRYGGRDYSQNGVLGYDALNFGRERGMGIRCVHK